MFNKIIQWLIKLIYNSEDFMRVIQKEWNPEPQGEITHRALYNLFKKHKIDNINITDSKYSLARLSDIVGFLSNDKINFRKYVPEKYDCDNFAFSLMGKASFMLSGYALGIVFVKTKTGAHALNFYVDSNKNLWYIEPQTDRMFTFSSKKDYKPYFILM